MKNYDPNTSDCCGAARDDDYGICLDCKEHCDGVMFEDAEGEPVAMYVDERGMLSDVPPFKPSLEAFIKDAPNHLLAACALIIVALCGCAILAGVQ